MRFSFSATVLLLIAAGCEGPNVVPVSGTVTLDEKPLAHATVVFQPIADIENPGPGSAGRTNDKGQFTLQLATGKGQGALVGKHKVSITAYEGDGEESSSGSDAVNRKALVPHRYNVLSDLTFEVPAGGTTSANFDLKSSEPPQK